MQTLKDLPEQQSHSAKTTRGSAPKPAHPTEERGGERGDGETQDTGKGGEGDGKGEEEGGREGGDGEGGREGRGSSTQSDGP